MTRSFFLLGLILLGAVAVSGTSRNLKQLVPFVALTCDFQGPFPYMVSLKTQAGEHLCGGVLISKTSVLTAAHCIDPRSSPRSNPYPQISIGGFDQENPIEKRWTVAVTPHPEWNGLRQFGNDLAILKLNRPTCVKNIPSLGTDQLYSMPTIFLGFGRTSTNGQFSHKLLAGNFAALDQQTCKSNQAFPLSSVPGETFCAQGPAGTGGVCEGDEGGPSILRPSLTEFRDQIAGIASYTSGSGECSDKNSHAIFTDVSYYRDWIRSKM